MSKLAIGTYSGQKPRLGICAPARANAERNRTILPNMAAVVDLPCARPVSLYIHVNRGAQDRWPATTCIPLCFTYYTWISLRYTLSLSLSRPPRRRPLAVNVARRLVVGGNKFTRWTPERPQAAGARRQWRGRGRHAQPTLCYAISSSNERYFFEEGIHRFTRGRDRCQPDNLTRRQDFFRCRFFRL